jgi:hypothetical protein
MLGLSRIAFVGSTSTGLEAVQKDLLAWARQLHALPVADAEDGPLERAASVPLLSGLRLHRDAYGDGGIGQIDWSDHLWWFYEVRGELRVLPELGGEGLEEVEDLIEISS